jgi:hypothetical protein
MHGAEDKKAAANTYVIIEDGLLNVRLARENKEGTDSEWLDLHKVCALRRSRNPILMLGKQLPHSLKSRLSVISGQSP